ncbi:uncharacterized protein LOC133203370 [Saccostrea echinata]|uniref:uncharacterized protein LOC133203370 n=1 Tax=Saccostrea echinata TaxID=191078 RepID=UPI002A83D021|nr:uncharacterized protein LOC133203370 [Saccostrea echinata]
MNGLLISIFVILGVSRSQGVLQGDVHLGGLFQLFSDGECKNDINEMSVRNFEAVKWTLNKLNQDKYIPGIKLGIEVFPTCNVQGKAVEHASKIINRRFTKQTDESVAPIIGIIGPEYSHEAVDTSLYISSLEKNNVVLQTLFSATASALRDGNKYQNILRVVPDDTKQISVIISLLQKLEWNYIGVIYENNTYGIGNFEDFRIQTKSRQICIAYASAVSMENGLVKSQELQTLIESVIFHIESRITGVIVFASTKTAKVFLNVANKLKDQYSFRLGIIFSEGSINIDKATLNQYRVAKGSFFTSPPWLSSESFQLHWSNVMTNKTAFNQEVSSNPWLENVVEKFISCDIRDDNCLMPTFSNVNSVTGDNVFEGYAILSAILQAKILKDLHREVCGEAEGLCPNLNSTLWNNSYKLVERGRYTNISLKEDILKIYDKTLKVTFNGKTDGNIEGDIYEYEVYHFRNCILRSHEMCLESVGEYSNSTFYLNTNLLRDYTKNDNGLAWPDIIKAQCDNEKKCVSCRNSNLANEVIFKEGDIYVAAVVPVYNKDIYDPMRCGNIRTSNGWEVVEGIRFAIDTVNGKLDSFSNMFGRKKIGYVIFNSCNQPLLIQAKLLNFFREGLYLSDGSLISDITNKTLGFVAAYGSTISIATANVLQELNLPQISYASTAAVLSDKSTYKYFLRTCTPDDKQALAMISIVETLNSSYIQIIYSEGTYGEGGRNAIVLAAKDKKICISNEIKVKENQYKKIRDDLHKTPYATVVLLFLRSHVVQDVMDELHETINPWSYLFIGSEAFGTQDILSGKHKLEGTITLSLQMKPVTGTSKFEKYLHDRLADVDNDVNPWTKEYFEQRNACFLSGSFNKLFASQCTDIKEEFNNKDYQPELWTAFAINAMFSLLQGTNKSFGELCGSQSSNLCQRHRDSPQKVYDMIKNEKLVIDDSGIPSKVFDENGDGNIGYKIYQVQRKSSDASQLTFVEIGRYTLDENGYSVYEKVIKDPFKTLPSKCPNPLECQKCSEQVNNQPISPSLMSEENSILPLVLGVLLGLAVLALVVVSGVLFKVRRGCEQSSDDPYLDPRFSSSLGTDSRDSGYCVSPNLVENVQNVENMSDLQTQRQQYLKNAAYQGD